MRTAFVLSLTLVLGACFGPCAEPEVAAPPSEEPAPGIGGVPPPIVVGTGAPPRAAPGPAHAEIWNEDREKAIEAALPLVWQSLDHDEMSRVVALLWEEIGNRDRWGDEEREVDFEELRSMIGSSDLPELLESLPEPKYEGHLEYILGNLHRQVRAAHLPLLCEIALTHEDPFARQTALDNLRIALDYTDRHREVVARTLLAVHAVPETPAVAPERSDGPGYPALLVDCLERFFPSGTEPPYRDWLFRWMRDSTPGPKDADLLIRLSFRTDYLLQGAAYLAIGELEDEASLEALGSANEFAALAARVLRGDSSALGPLRRNAVLDADWLAMLLFAAPGEGRDLLGEVLLGEDDGRADQLLETLTELDASRHRWAVDPGAEAFAGLAEAALRSRAPGWRLARIGVRVPGCGPRAVAAKACRLIEAFPPREFPGGYHRDALAFLDSVAPEAVRRAFRSAAKSDVVEIRDTAREALFLLGDAESGSPVLAWLRSLGEPDDGELLQLGRSPSDEVRGFLAQREAIDALAVAAGIPEDLELSYAVRGFEAEERANLIRLLATGRGVDALARVTELRPDDPIWNVGLVKDPRIEAYLRRLTRIRSANLYAWAVGELAVMGDAPARSEMLGVFRTGRYRWVDNAGAIQMTFGRELAMIPFWLDDLESNCCRFNVVAGVFEELLGLDLDAHRRASARHAAQVARTYWAEHGGRFVWSDVVGRYLPRAEVTGANLGGPADARDNERMAKLKITFHGEPPKVFEGPQEKVDRLSARIYEAMSGAVDTIITHDFDVEPRSFLISEIANVHPLDD